MSFNFPFLYEKNKEKDYQEQIPLYQELPIPRKPIPDPPKTEEETERGIVIIQL